MAERSERASSVERTFAYEPGTHANPKKKRSPSQERALQKQRRTKQAEKNWRLLKQQDNKKELPTLQPTYVWRNLCMAMSIDRITVSAKIELQQILNLLMADIIGIIKQIVKIKFTESELTAAEEVIVTVTDVQQALLRRNYPIVCWPNTYENLEALLPKERRRCPQLDPNKITDRSRYIYTLQSQQNCYRLSRGRFYNISINAITAGDRNVEWVFEKLALNLLQWYIESQLLRILFIAYQTLYSTGSSLLTRTIVNSAYTVYRDFVHKKTRRGPREFLTSVQQFIEDTQLSEYDDEYEYETDPELEEQRQSA